MDQPKSSPLYFPDGTRAYHCDKAGQPISTEQWAKLDGDPAYKFHLVTKFAGDAAHVTTIYNGLDAYGAGPVPFSSLCRVKDELKSGRRWYGDDLFEEHFHVDEPVALAGHIELVQKLAAWLASKP